MRWSTKRATEFAEQAMRDRVAFNILKGPIEQDLGAGEDLVVVRSGGKVAQIRLTIDRADVGNGNAYNQDGDLAVQLQAENAGGDLFGPISRFDDEGITFRSAEPGVKFDIRDRVSGAQSGLFDVAQLGTARNDHYDYSGVRGLDIYINGGSGDDHLAGGAGDDHPVGGAGDDLIDGGAGDDLLVGGAGDDTVLGGQGDDTFVVFPATDGADTVDLGKGLDTVNVLSPPREYRLTLTTYDIGDGDAHDGGDGPGEDGGLAVRFQAEDGAGGLTGPVSRYDDEGISFVGGSGVTFEIDDLPSGIVRGQGFGVARLGTSGDDVYNEQASSVRTFINAGAGDDVIRGGSGDDLLVGLFGDDRVLGGAGNDIVVGEQGDDWLDGGAGNDILFPLAGVDTLIFRGKPGDDTVMTYEAGIDKIDLSAYGIGLEDVTATSSGANTFVKVDTNGDGSSDFTIALVNSGPPADADYIF